MCGISASFIKSEKNKYWDLLRNSEIRGQDGTGFALYKWNRPGHFVIQKNDKKASLITDFPELKGKDFVVGQNRLAIFGLEKQNIQPIVTERTILVHNGNLYDFEKTFKEEGLKRELEVDSELILRLWEKYENIDEVKKRLKGDYACILVVRNWRVRKQGRGRKIIIFKKYKPIYYYEDDTGLYYYSTAQIGKKTFGVEGTPLKNNEVVIKTI